jgi:hypothetical protein
MRVKGQVGQIICTCGRVGELRTRSNGQFLPFLMCKHCGMKQGKDKLREEWLANEKPDNSLGVYGEFPSGSDRVLTDSASTSNKTSTAKVLKQSTTSNQLQKDWQPEGDLIPEQLQVESAAKPDQTGETSSSGLGLGGKIFLGVLSVAALAFGATKFNFSN